MTRTQNSQKLRKTMIHFFLFHICLSWSPVSHCLSCSVIVIKTANFFFALKFLLCACFNEKLRITMGSHYISQHLTWALTSEGSPEASFWFSQSRCTQTGKGAQWDYNSFTYPANRHEWNTIRLRPKSERELSPPSQCGREERTRLQWCLSGETARKEGRFSRGSSF